ncbi:MAG TPA: tripartite tricarboxylate transporter substrate binding protein [Burkholderiales bacterium]|nr:tripartite tricarboxylate transporter substrate binding protein [Burkholderiales bacterium]
MRALKALLAVIAMVATGPALAQAWPNKPIRLVVNFPPGGAADQIARSVGVPLGEALGQPIVIENRPGANGNIGADAVAKSPPDGYTLLMSSGGAFSVNPHLYTKLPFDPVKDLVPVAAAARILVFLVVRPDLPAKSVDEFVALARANPGKLTYGSPGSGSSPHIAGEMLKRAANIDIVHVPYKGAAPALTDLLGGQLDFMFDPGIGLPQVRAGKLRLLAVGSPKRSPLFPDTPTLAEAGMVGFDADSWFGFYAPAGVPADILARLNREINRALQTPAVRDRITGLGAEAVALSADEFAALQRADRERFGVVVREAGIKLD